ncbi:MAG TPA: sialidase family protein [Lentisphaeria bacterium]|nr:sialidase family protein [Lentisphaeria bacterium]
MTTNNDSLRPVPVTTPTAKHANRTFQGIPGFTIAPNGRFFACWYGGGKGEGPDNFVLVKTSADQGRTWQGPIAVVDPPGPNIRAFDSTLWTDPDGRVWLFWAQSFSPGINTIADGVNGVWTAYLKRTDDFSDWSAPIRIYDGIMLNKPTVLPDGAWGFPVSIWAQGVGGGNPPERLLPEIGAGLVVTNDHGRTFSRRGGFLLDQSIFDEHHIVALRDGRLWALVRTRYGVGQAYSCDGGVTWTDTGPAAIAGPNSRFFLTRLRSGRILLVNHRPPAKPIESDAKTIWKTRSHLAAYLSDDDGATWVGDLLLDERSQISYPDGCQDSDGRIWIIYDHDRYGKGDILLTAFTEEDILNAQNAAAKPLPRLTVDSLADQK